MCIRDRSGSSGTKPTTPSRVPLIRKILSNVLRACLLYTSILYIGESFIDCISHYQLCHSGSDLNLVYVSTEGTFTEGQDVYKRQGKGRLYIKNIFVWLLHTSNIKLSVFLWWTVGWKKTDNLILLVCSNHTKIFLSLIHISIPERFLKKRSLTLAEA